MRAIRNPTGIRERRLSALQLEVLEAAPIEARKTPPRAHWSYYIGKRPVSASVKILIREGFLILEERAPRRGVALATEKGLRTLHLNGHY